MGVAIPVAVKPLLNEYIAEMEHELSGFMTACYVHGSLALGAFQPPFSDIDFITVINRRSTPQVIECIRAIHQRLQKKYPQWPLSGSYLQASDLGKSTDAIEAAPYYQDGVLHESGHFEINRVTWWVLKHHGLTVFGPDVQHLDFNVEWDHLVTEMRENLNTYWVRFARPSRRVLWLFSDDGIQWVILGILRQYYTFRAHDITSKTGAGEYALQHLPQQWHQIMQEALNIRHQIEGTQYRFRMVRAVDAFRFMKYIIRLCNTIID